MPELQQSPPAPTLRAEASVIPLIVASCVATPILGLFTLLALVDFYVFAHLSEMGFPSGVVVDRPSLLEFVVLHLWRYAIPVAGWAGLVLTWVSSVKAYRRLVWVGAAVALACAASAILLSLA